MQKKRCLPFQSSAAKRSLSRNIFYAFIYDLAYFFTFFVFLSMPRVSAQRMNCYVSYSNSIRSDLFPASGTTVLVFGHQRSPKLLNWKSQQITFPKPFVDEL